MNKQCLLSPILHIVQSFAFPEDILYACRPQLKRAIVYWSALPPPARL